MAKEIIKEAVTDEPVEEINTCIKQAVDVEDDCIMVMTGAWARRVYFDLPWNLRDNWKDNYKNYKGKFFEISYIGDIDDAFNVKLLPIKNLN